MISIILIEEAIIPMISITNLLTREAKRMSEEKINFSETDIN